jgi:preprotein translocase subunit SecG
MKKVTAVLVSVLCVLSLNLAFAGSPKATDSGKGGTTTTERPRFQR